MYHIFFEGRNPREARAYSRLPHVETENHCVARAPEVPQRVQHVLPDARAGERAFRQGLSGLFPEAAHILQFSDPLCHGKKEKQPHLFACRGSCRGSHEHLAKLDEELRGKHGSGCWALKVLISGCEPGGRKLCWFPSFPFAQVPSLPPSMCLSLWIPTWTIQRVLAHDHPRSPSSFSGFDMYTLFSWLKDLEA